MKNSKALLLLAVLLSYAPLSFADLTEFRNIFSQAEVPSLEYYKSREGADCSIFFELPTVEGTVRTKSEASIDFTEGGLVEVHEKAIIITGDRTQMFLRVTKDGDLIGEIAAPENLELPGGYKDLQLLPTLRSVVNPDLYVAGYMTCNK